MKCSCGKECFPSAHKVSHKGHKETLCDGCLEAIQKQPGFLAKIEHIWLSAKTPPLIASNGELF